MLVKSLVALATEKMLLKTSGKTFLRGIDFMYAAGLAPDRLSVMMTASGKYVLQFHSKCDIRPFAANYPSFTRVLRGIVHVKAWRIKSIEFVNVAFDIKDVDNLERTVEKLEVELVLLRNCSYPGVRRGDEAIRFLNALNRRKQAVVCEYGDIRLKHMISRQPPRPASNNLNSQQFPPMFYDFYRFLQNEHARVRRREIPYARRRGRNNNGRRDHDYERAPLPISPEMMDLVQRYYDNHQRLQDPNARPDAADGQEVEANQPANPAPRPEPGAEPDIEARPRHRPNFYQVFAGLGPEPAAQRRRVDDADALTDDEW